MPRWVCGWDWNDAECVFDNDDSGDNDGDDIFPEVVVGVTLK